MPPFESKGDKPQWQMIYDELLAPNGVPADFHTILPHEAICAAAGKDDFKEVWGWEQARRKFLRDHRRSVIAVKNVGYRVVHPTEQGGKVRGRFKRGRRQMNLGVEEAVFTDRSFLTPAEQAHQDRLELAITRIADMTQRLDTRAAQDQAVLHAQRKTASPDKWAKVEAELRRHGIDARPSEDADD